MSALLTGKGRKPYISAVMKALHMITFTLLLIGGLNWLLEAFGYGIGKYLPDAMRQVIYILVGISAIIEIATHKKNCTACCCPSSMPTAVPKA